METISLENRFMPINRSLTCCTFQPMNIAFDRRSCQSNQSLAIVMRHESALVDRSHLERASPVLSWLRYRKVDTRSRVNRKRDRLILSKMEDRFEMATVLPGEPFWMSDDLGT